LSSLKRFSFFEKFLVAGMDGNFHLFDFQHPSDLLLPQPIPHKAKTFLPHPKK